MKNWEKLEEINKRMLELQEKLNELKRNRKKIRLEDD